MTVTLDANGNIVLPETVRHKLGLTSAQTVTLKLTVQQDETKEDVPIDVIPVVSEHESSFAHNNPLKGAVIHEGDILSPIGDV